MRTQIAYSMGHDLPGRQPGSYGERWQYHQPAYVVDRKRNVYLGIWVYGLINALSGLLLLGLVPLPSQ